MQVFLGLKNFFLKFVFCHTNFIVLSLFTNLSAPPLAILS
jgi:hypothetical protein